MVTLLTICLAFAAVAMLSALLTSDQEAWLGYIGAPIGMVVLFSAAAFVISDDILGLLTPALGMGLLICIAMALGALVARFSRTRRTAVLRAGGLGFFAPVLLVFLLGVAGMMQV